MNTFAVAASIFVGIWLVIFSDGKGCLMSQRFQTNYLGSKVGNLINFDLLKCCPAFALVAAVID
jgi:hypothetical protein